MHSPYELHLALRYLRFRRGRTSLSVITVVSVAGFAVGTAALVIALALMAGFVDDVRARIHSGSAHLTILDAGAPGVFEGAEDLARRLEAIPGVRAAAPVLYTPALLTVDGIDSPGFAEIHGIDPAAHARVILAPGTEGPFGKLSAPESGKEGIVLGEGLANKIGVMPGDLVRLVVPSATITALGVMPRVRTYEVVGTYRSSHFQEDTVRGYILLSEARALLRAKTGSSWVEVRVDDLHRLEEMKERLRTDLGSGWLVFDLIEQNRDLLKALETEKLILFLAIGLIVVVAALNIVSTLILMVTDKVKEIGTLTAMGAEPWSIAKVFVLQGAVIGAVGTTVGLVLGASACWALDRYEVIRLNPEVYYLDHIPFRTEISDLLAVGATALAISLVATIYPATRAARLDPVEAVRHE